MTCKKAAIFVEGQTELVFVEQLLKEVAGESRITLKTIGAGSNVVLRGLAAEGDNSFFVLIVDCGGDSQVKTKILDNRAGLIRESYELVIGLLDLYPFSKAELNKVVQGLRYGVPTKDIAIKFSLSIMEVEAWFIQENTHFERIDASLTSDCIRAALGYDPDVDSAEDIGHPADFLKQIYQLAGMGYSKSKKQVQRTVGAIDYGNLYLHTKDKCDSLKRFIDRLDHFLTT